MPGSGREYDGNSNPDVPPDRAAWSARHPTEGIDGISAHVRAAHANVAAPWLSRPVDGRFGPLP